MESATPNIQSDTARSRPRAAMRNRRGRMLFVGITDAIWQRLAGVAERAGYRPQRATSGDEALLMLAIEPALATVIVMHSDRTGEGAHLQQWVPVIAPQARLMTMSDLEWL